MIFPCAFWTTNHRGSEAVTFGGPLPSSCRRVERCCSSSLQPCWRSLKGERRVDERVEKPRTYELRRVCSGRTRFNPANNLRYWISALRTPGSGPALIQPKRFRGLLRVGYRRTKKLSRQPRCSCVTGCDDTGLRCGHLRSRAGIFRHWSSMREVSL